MFLPSKTVGEDIELMNVCMTPLMCPLYFFIGGGTPKATLDKIEFMVPSVTPGDRGLYEFISQWGRYACVASEPFGAEINSSSVLDAWQDFPRGVDYDSWAEGRFRVWYTAWQARSSAPSRCGTCK